MDVPNRDVTLSVMFELRNAVKYLRPIVRTSDSNHNEILVDHIIYEVDVVPAVRDELVMVLAKSEVSQPLFDRRRSTQHVCVMLQQTAQKHLLNSTKHTAVSMAVFPSLCTSFQRHIRHITWFIRVHYTMLTIFISNRNIKRVEIYG